MFWCLILFAWMSSCFAVVCYDCYDTGPNHENCTKERSCTGLACMIFDAADGNNTMTAFCLWPLKVRSIHVLNERISSNDSCWWEPEGHHCICYTDFCNHLIDSVRKYENKNPLLPKALYLKHNPLIDYGDSTKDSATDTKPIFGTHPLIEIETAHLRTSGNSQENGQLFLLLIYLLHLKSTSLLHGSERQKPLSMES
ncbi:hypothetical protein DICVIV_07430 [Dictyocaulus viviparus]|uniref:Protein quiver n=1 Tax=Dictyocaulus viviparus TaxID=29172 RepID=A0A0D8XVZ0_DICVI|nr:hypothetical protein DICVIV_07430 [Dictyocaulus viviparus]